MQRSTGKPAGRQTVPCSVAVEVWQLWWRPLISSERSDWHRRLHVPKNATPIALLFSSLSQTIIAASEHCCCFCSKSRTSHRRLQLPWLLHSSWPAQPSQQRPQGQMPRRKCVPTTLLQRQVDGMDRLSLLWPFHGSSCVRHDLIVNLFCFSMEVYWGGCSTQCCNPLHHFHGQSEKIENSKTQQLLKFRNGREVHPVSFLFRVLRF